MPDDIVQRFLEKRRQRETAPNALTRELERKTATAATLLRSAEMGGRDLTGWSNTPGAEP